MDNVIKAIARLPEIDPSGVVQAWSAADTALCVGTALGYVSTIFLTCLLSRRVQGLQGSLAKITTQRPRLFRSRETPTQPDTEQPLNLIEITPAIPHRQPDQEPTLPRAASLEELA